MGSAVRRHGRHWASRSRAISPARSRTLRWREIAGRLMLNGSARALTVAAPKPTPRLALRRPAATIVQLTADRFVRTPRRATNATALLLHQRGGLRARAATWGAGGALVG